ncbi:MAG TPA: hypothetical protein VJT74_17670, partial [Pyrinomonadaceae bacterium]|nr:hypothetical protein [Pyrinomonadaceae bacterium]
GPSGTAPAQASEFFDDFKAAELDASWQWPMESQQVTRVETSSGRLVLQPAASQSDDDLTSAVLAQRTVSGDYVATTLVDTRALGVKGRAGLSAYSWRGRAVGISVGGGRVFAWRREGRELQTRATENAPAANQLYLRMTVKDGEQFRFAYSTDGREWKELGGAINAGDLEGARVALVAGGATATARFDWLRVTQAAKKG